MGAQATIAYFSMEIALAPAIPTYAGGLGVLAGDTVRSAADLGLPLVAVSLLHRRGFFHQELAADGSQSESPVAWTVEKYVEPLEPRVEVQIESRPVRVRAWRYRVRGVGGLEVPVYLLDTDLPENEESDRRITDSLYGGDLRYRLCQEAVLGIGGARMLRALGHGDVEHYHLNEGHAALVVFGLLEARLGERCDAAEVVRQLEEIRCQCIFTTHTPVPAGHDRFDHDLACRVLGEEICGWLEALGQRELLSMTDLAFRSSHFVNGVAMRHGEVSRSMFPQYPIRSITNGIHPATWVGPSMRALFDRHIPDWRRDAMALRYAISIPTSEIWWAHSRCKGALVDRVNREAGSELQAGVFTIGFARRATSYKRATLIFHDLERLKAIAAESQGLQLVFAGKAHPHDAEGKEMIRRVFAAREALRGCVAVAYLPDYDMESARLLCAGSDVWLNTPIPPLEASGTSGMKAALNGVPSLSVLDGWWLEGHVEGVTGWSIGSDAQRTRGAPPASDREHAEALYQKLRGTVLPCYYDNRGRYLEIMRYAIALNASFFNTQRMLLQYLYGAYREPLPEGGLKARGTG